MNLLTQHTAITSIAHLSSQSHEAALLLIAESNAEATQLLDQVEATVAGHRNTIRFHADNSPADLHGLVALLGAICTHSGCHAAHGFAPTSKHPLAIHRSARQLAQVLRECDLEPTLLLIDGVDTMDSSSQVLLALVVEHLEGTNLTIVGTAAPLSISSPLRNINAAHLTSLAEDEVAMLAATLSLPVAVAVPHQVRPRLHLLGTQRRWGCAHTDHSASTCKAKQTEA